MLILFTVRGLKCQNNREKMQLSEANIIKDLRKDMSGDSLPIKNEILRINQDIMNDI